MNSQKIFLFFLFFLLIPFSLNAVEVQLPSADRLKFKIGRALLEEHLLNTTEIHITLADQTLEARAVLKIVEQVLGWYIQQPPKDCGCSQPHPVDYLGLCTIVTHAILEEDPEAISELVNSGLLKPLPKRVFRSVADEIAFY